MKFSHSLQFNAVPEWSSKYIAYSQLKKLAYELRKEKLYGSSKEDRDDEGRTPLVREDERYDERFMVALDKELRKIDKFFVSQETGILSNYEELKDDVEEFQREVEFAVKLHNGGSGGGSGGRKAGKRHSGGSSDEGSLGGSGVVGDDYAGMVDAHSRKDAAIPLLKQRPTTGAGSDVVESEPRMLLQKRLVMMFTQLSELRSYFELNRTGFSKICKKFDKLLETDVKQRYLSELTAKYYIFDPATIENISRCIDQTIVMYARLKRGGSSGNYVADNSVNFQEAENELSLHLREHVVWERNTVWKEMLNLERKSQTVKTHKLTNKPARIVANEVHVNSTLGASDLLRLTPKDWFNWLLSCTSLLKFICITFVFFGLLNFSPLQDKLQKNCLAILIYTSLLWATETIPLFVTSMLVPFLVVVFPVLRSAETNSVMSAKEASSFILSSMWSGVIMLLLGGFTLAAALSKYNIAQVLSTHILSSAGTNPKAILLVNMLVALFTSMWVSNVAAPVLCYSVIQPLLRTLPRGSNFAKSLILGVALASNIGGMASPIASPQNIISIGAMNPPPSWLEWFFISIPVCEISVFLIWILLLVTFPRDNNLKLPNLHPTNESFSLRQWYVIFVTILTIILWCFANQLSSLVGDMGIISITPMVLLFGTGLLDSDDFNNFMWTIVILAMGGSCLGKAVMSSGLLNTMAHIIKAHLENSPLFLIVLVFGVAILTMATFVSHTVAAMILVPLMQEVGSSLPGGDHSRLLVMLTVLLCSGAMGLPTSGFPNVTAISMIDDFGDRYLNVNTFISRGVPASILTYTVIVTVGYFMMTILGF
ncbi:Pho91p Ecym_2111 [Eremothecium cymbalariae DBVPG|uniref:SPX domain-containing protein n=1 Tax=Eremothecium cymbalariae (strain CBS 270.75 / DBVPG 7215 / KCTC 17166 / NRRL Y-17582) TaxID=931890 RepID=G8JPL5_ERECY|nr:Hypothetical protein Ecym_2111 [Eremothecium cymbalariae DBVPG\